MTAFLDTSVLVAGLVEAHPEHEHAFRWLLRVRNGEVTGSMAAHSVAESYAVLSTLPLNPRISPVSAWTLIEHSLLPFFHVVELTAGEVQEVIRRMSRQGYSGGIVYDALIAEAAAKGGAEVLLTLNIDDFRRVVGGAVPEVTRP
jgi:predicted nucleic acid-binding protein